MQYNFDSAQMGHDGIHSIPDKNPELSYAQQAMVNLSMTFEMTHTDISGIDISQLFPHFF